MIKRLYIKDFAIIGEVDLEFKPGLTVITGETGSGKSILLQALSVALGAKGTKTMVRTGKDRAVVEANVKNTVYRRLLSSGGRTKSYINDEPLNEANFLARVSSLVDFHGQHEQQLIMNRDTHINYLDSYCNTKTDVSNISEIFQALQTARKRMETTRETMKKAEERQELLEFQSREISTVNPKPGEDILLENEYKTLSHIEELAEGLITISQSLTEADQSIYNQLSASINNLEKLVKYDNYLEAYLEGLNNALVTIQDASGGFVEHVNALDHDQEHLKEITDRYIAIQELKRKYGGSLEAVLDYQQEIVEDLENLTGLDRQIKDLEQEIANLEQQYQAVADHLHNTRTTVSEELSGAIEAEMHKLNMPSAKFSIRISQKPEKGSFAIFKDKQVQANLRGYDQVEFLLSANPGERPKPLIEIASGGEISRIMLAIKSVFQKHDPVNTMIFDEIDSGISGSAAEKVADNLVTLSKNKQVICITHLPQIASRANFHLHVTKIIHRAETRVSARYLDKDERVQVIAQLFSGNNFPDEFYRTYKSFIEMAHG